MKTFERLKEERIRLGLNQSQFAAIGGVQKGAQINYEQGKRNPDSDYLAAIAISGVDVQYILTGVRSGNTSTESKDQTSSYAMDMERLILAIETVEEGLQKTKRTMLPEKKAQLIMAVYDLFEEPTPATKQSVLRLVQSAA